MKILFVDTYYQSFLNDFYKKNDPRGLVYEKQIKMLMSSFFGTADSYSYYLQKLGHSSTNIIVNDEILQGKWAEENGLRVNSSGLFSKLQSLPYLYRLIGRPDWVQVVALAQIKKIKPDVLYMQDLSILNPETLREAKKHCRILVGQIAYLLPPKKYLDKFDLILTSFPHYVARFIKMGINSEYFKIGFDPRVLEKVGKQRKKYDVTFVGGFTPQHSAGTRVLEEIAREIPVHVWGRGKEFLSPVSTLRRNYHKEEVYGLDMYKILAQSKIVLNRHIDAAENYANNMRLYETTGMGAMLLTDKKKNLNDLFEVGREVVDYSSSQDAVKKIKYFLAHDEERSKTAEAGQMRTLSGHTYKARMEELVQILLQYKK